MNGYPCPKCGEWTAIARQSGRDTEGRRVRRRQCTHCAHSFATVEAVSPVSFYKLAESARPRRLTVSVVEVMA